MRRYGLIVAAAVLLATGVAGSAVAGGPTGSASTGPVVSSGVTSSGLSPARRKAKRKAISKCHKIKKPSRRRLCVKGVNKRFRPRQIKPAAPGPIGATIDVRDKYFSPDVVNIKRGESILWVWSDLNKDAHNVDLTSGPAGVKRVDFSTVSSPSRGFEFRRTFTVPGQYNFACSIHHLMTMTVDVSG